MAFFEVPPPVEPPPPPPREPWQAPPAHIVGGTAQTDAVVARTEDTVLSLGRVQAFPSGFLVELRIIGAAREGSAGPATQLDLRFTGDQDLVVRGGSGGGLPDDVHLTYWVSPLPPEGPIVAVLSWPERGIEDATAELDADAIRAAAARAEQVRPEPPQPPPRPEWTVPPPPRHLDWAPGDLARFQPGVAALELELGRREASVVTVSHALVYPHGWQLDVMWSAPGGRRDEWRPGDPGAVPDTFVRFGLELADGRRAANLTRPADPSAESLVLLPTSGGGSTGRGHQKYWVWPLPPPGKLAFWCEWPAQGIAETRTEIDAAVILDAAARATG